MKEIIRLSNKTTKLSITNNQITAVLQSEEQRTGVRLYDKEKIGIAGAIGECKEKDLFDRAEAMLKYNVAYDCAPTADIKKSIDRSEKNLPSVAEFIEITENALKKTGSLFTDFVFNGTAIFNHTETLLKNEAGLELFCKDSSFTPTLLYKHKKSKDLFDGTVEYRCRTYKPDMLLAAMAETLPFYDSQTKIEDGTMPVIFGQQSSIYNKFAQDLNDRLYVLNASPLSGKIGQKLFSGKLSLAVSRDADSFHNFFDHEGVMLTNDRFNLIENGVFVSPYTSKKTAKMYNLPLTACGYSGFDSVPQTAYWGLDAGVTGNLKEILAGRLALYITVASGGDFTPAGDFATPVQQAFLTDGEKILGRLSGLSVSSNLFQMFGDSFLGAVKPPFVNTGKKHIVMNMDVKTDKS